jgi:hypothetical protein
MGWELAVLFASAALREMILAAADGRAKPPAAERHLKIRVNLCRRRVVRFQLLVLSCQAKIRVEQTSVTVV